MNRSRNKVTRTDWKLFLEKNCSLNFKQQRRISYGFSKSLKKFVKKLSFGKLSGWQPEKLQKNDFFTDNFQGVCLIFRNTYFKENVSVAAWKMTLSLKKEI